MIIGQGLPREHGLLEFENHFVHRLFPYVHVQEFAAEAKMSYFHEVDATGAGLTSASDAENRVPLGTAIVVILGLSALCWADLIGIAIVVRAVL